MEKQSKDSNEEQNVMQEAAESLGMFFAAASSGMEVFLLLLSENIFLLMQES